MWNASDEILERLRDHTHWISGVRSYDYKSHHSYRAKELNYQYQQLKRKSPQLAIYGEPSLLGDFGFQFKGELFNIDTLKFHESILAISLSGNLARLQNLSRPIVCEIGAGWGGFAAMFLRHVPRAQYVVVDLEPTLIFSGVYLQECFPDKSFGFFGSKDYKGTEDIIFVTAGQFASWKTSKIDLAINLVSFQEMTDLQVKCYSEELTSKNTTVLYSHNKQKSRNNSELSSVNKHFDNWPERTEQEVLEWDYSEMFEHASLSRIITTDSRIIKIMRLSVAIIEKLPDAIGLKLMSNLKLVAKPSIYNYLMTNFDDNYFRDRYRHYFFYSNLEFRIMEER